MCYEGALLLRPVKRTSPGSGICALFVALGGTSYAVAQLPRNSVGAAQIERSAVGASELRRGAVRSRALRNRSVALRDISPGARSALRGAKGALEAGQVVEDAHRVERALQRSDLGTRAPLSSACTVDPVTVPQHRGGEVRLGWRRCA